MNFTEKYEKIKCRYKVSVLFHFLQSPLYFICHLKLKIKKSKDTICYEGSSIVTGRTLNFKVKDFLECSPKVLRSPSEKVKRESKAAL